MTVKEHADLIDKLLAEFEEEEKMLDRDFEGCLMSQFSQKMVVLAMTTNVNFALAGAFIAGMFYAGQRKKQDIGVEELENLFKRGPKDDG